MTIREAVAIFADDIGGGFEAGGLRLGQQPRGFGAEAGVRLIQRVEQEQVAQVKEARVDLAKIQIVAAPQGIGASGMKERSPPMPLLGHHVGVRSGRFGGDAQVLDVHLVLAARSEDMFAKGVLAYQAGGEERERGAGPGEVHQDVIGRASGALGLATNVGELFRLRIHIDHLDLVDDPVAAGEQAGAGYCAFLFHAVSP